MKQSYSNYSFNPSEQVLAIIKQYAYTFRPICVDGQYISSMLN